jgi:hypothetical protein
MLWAQITMLCLYGISLLMGANMHGKPKKPGTHSFISDAICVAIAFTLAYCAGAFSRIF